MDATWLMVLAVLAGVLVGAGGVLAFRLSARRQGRGAVDDDDAPPLSADAVSVLAVLRSSVVVLDADDDVLRASPSAFGYGLIRHDRLAHDALQRLVRGVRTDGVIRDEDLELPRSPVPGAGTLRLQVRVAPLGNDRVLLLADDHTAARRLEDMRRDFTANVSHELKTPVGAIALLAETVADSADDPEAVRHFAQRMKRESRRLGDLVQEIIDLSRLQEPDALVEPELVDIDEVVEEATDRVSVAARARKIVVTHGGTGGLRVHGDRSLLTTAVRNLLDNALHYSAPATRVSVGVSRRDGLVRIAVVDQGVGIPEDKRERVFERFYRVDPARSRETGGTGLGLSIVKHIAADHGGAVELWSAPGRGSTFTLVLPEAESAETQGAEAGAHQRPAARTEEDE